MLGSIIGLILLLIFLGVVWWGIEQLLPLIPLPPPFRTIVRVLLVILLAGIVLYVIAVLLGFAGVHVATPIR